MRHHLGIALAIVSSLGLLASTARAAEVCSDGLDNDADSMADEGCWPAGVTSVCENPLSCGITGAVAPKLGAIVYPLPPDLDPNVAYGPSITFRRTYMGHYRPGTGTGTRNPFGNSFVHNWMSWLDKNTGVTPNTVIVHLPSGQEVLFTKTSTSGGYDNYAPQLGAHYKFLRQSTSSPFKWELQSLTGETLVYDWSSPSGKLIEVRDALATPNVVTISYDGSGRVQYVTDAQGAKRLSFTYSAQSKLTRVDYETIASGTPTSRAHAVFAYNSGQLQNYQPNGGTVAQQYTYSSAKLTLIEDNNGTDLIAYDYLIGTAPTAAARVKTSKGELGFEYNSARAACSGGTMVYFNRKGATACDADTDCGAGLLCGGQIDPSSTNTGVCYRAARCVQTSSPSEDLVTTVTPIGPPSETCEGACTDTAEYAWNTSSVLDLKGVKDPNNHWTSYTYNANGLPTAIVYGDTDNDASNGGGQRTLWLYYGNASFPGLVTERRRQSDYAPGGTAACTSSTTAGCQRSIYTYDSNGQLTTLQEDGYTVNTSKSAVTYSYTTTYTHDSSGRLTHIDGPLAGSNDVTDITYWTSGSVFRLGQRQEIKRKKDSTNYLTTVLDDYDLWSNATSIQVPDTTYTCLTFDSQQNVVTQVREAMNGQTSCATTNGLDLVTSYTRDRALRLTKLEYPAGGCAIYEYDAIGRVARIKSRDDCLAGSSGDNQEYTYDDDSLLIKTESLDASGTVKRRQEQTYFDSRRLATVINPVAPTKWASITYNSRGFIDTIDGENNLSKANYTYDADDAVTTIKRYRDATNFDSWSIVDDWMKVLATVTDGDSKVIENRHDDLGRSVKVVTPDSGSTYRVYANDNTLTTVLEPGPSGTTLSHTYSYDNLKRVIAADYDGSCGAGAPIETSWSYDLLPVGVSCPIGSGCNRTAGRLSYARTSLLCTATGDKSLDQETFYSYDDAGRLVHEYVKDDTGRLADHQYTWTKNGALAQVTTPSGAVLGSSFGSAGDNSDQAKITSVWRTSTSTNIARDIQWFPFGPLKSYRHSNQISGNDLRTVISRNLADRPSQVRVEDVLGNLVFQAAITEDDKGRVTGRDFSGGHASLEDSFFLYDQLDRVVCETDTLVSSCPSAPSSQLKNSHDASPPFTASNDWKQFQRPIPGTSAYAHVVTLGSSKDQVASLTQTNSLGTTSYAYDARGNRTSDDNTSTLTHDGRTYTYEGRRNIRTIAGQFYTGTVWHGYIVTSAYDMLGRRVFKSVQDKDSGTEAHYFYYYDVWNRLIEIRQTPDASVSTTYSIYQISWINDRQVGLWRTDYPSSTTVRFYIHTDETTRPMEMYDWPSSGTAARTWATNPDAFGNDTCLTGCSLLQPFVFPGQFRDVETVAWQNDGVTPHRTSIVLNWFRALDPMLNAYVQVDPRAATTWHPYAYASNNPVGRADPTGLLDDDGGRDCMNACMNLPNPSTCLEWCECGTLGCDVGGDADQHAPGGGNYGSGYGPEGGLYGDETGCYSADWDDCPGGSSSLPPPTSPTTPTHCENVIRSRTEACGVCNNARQAGTPHSFEESHAARFDVIETTATEDLSPLPPGVCPDPRQMRCKYRGNQCMDPAICYNCRRCLEFQEEADLCH